MYVKHSCWVAIHCYPTLNCLLPLLLSMTSLDDANLVGNVQCIVVSCQADVCLLLAIGPASSSIDKPRSEF
jgi:hypothetical protein